MSGTKAFLIEWTIEYLKNKDLIFRRIESIEKKKDNFDFFINFKTKKQGFFIIDNNEDIESRLNELKEEDEISFVLFNSKSNFDKLIKSWKQLSDFKNISIYFINPRSYSDKVWVIFPYTHNRISEKETFKKGLLSLFSTVGEITEQQIKNLV